MQKKKGIRVEESSESEGEEGDAVAMAVGEPGELPPSGSDSSEQNSSEEDDEVHTRICTCICSDTHHCYFFFSQQYKSRRVLMASLKLKILTE